MSFKHPNPPTPDATDTIPIIQPTEPHPRNPRIHTPSNDIQTGHNEPSGEHHSLIHDTVSGKLGALKRTAYHMLAKTAHPLTQKTSVPAEEEYSTPDPEVDDAEKNTASAIDTNPYHHPTANPRRRFTSMPHPIPSSAISDTDYAELAKNYLSMRGGGNYSPPIVDFTRFEDTYRGPRNGTFEGLLAKDTLGRKGQGSVMTSKPSKERNSRMSSSNSTKKNRRSSRGSQLRHDSTTSMSMRITPSSLSTGLSRDNASFLTVAPQSACSRKPDPRSILVALREVEVDDSSRGLIPPRMKTVDSYFTTRELLEMHFLDQVDFEERDMVRQKLALTGNLEIEGGQGDLVVMGQSIRRASIYSSSTMILGGREHELPIVVISCIEELYRTGIYQPNLFRALPNRARLMELISIFDSEKQPPGSIIRNRSRPNTSRVISTNIHSTGTPRSSSHKHASGSVGPTAVNETPINGGFGAATSLHLESMPDICALLSTYISSLPEPVLPPFLFRALWELCGIEEDEIIKPNSEFEGSAANASSTPMPPATPMMRSYTSTYTTPLASSRILTAQLLLHLLPSPNFSLLVYFLAFFSQAALVREENGVGIEDLAKMFGGKIFGGGFMATGSNSVAGAPAPTSTEIDELKSNTAHNARRPSDASSVSNISASSVQPRRPSITTGVIPTPETRREGEVMMCWFLRRWGAISDGLFEILSSLGIEDEGTSSEEDKSVGLPRSITPEEEGMDKVKGKTSRKWSRISSTSTRSASPSSCHSSSQSPPPSPKHTPTFPKFLRRDTFGRIPLPQDWLDRLSSASRPISRSLSLTRSRSRSLSRSLSLSRSRSRSASPPLDVPEMRYVPTNASDFIDESGIVHARPQGRTRFQLGTEEGGSKKGRKRAASALPYTSSPSKSSPLWSLDKDKVDGDGSRAEGKRKKEKRSKEPSQQLLIPAPDVPMSLQMLEEMDIVDDYVMLSFGSPGLSTDVGRERLQAPAPNPPRVDGRLLDSFLREELAVSTTPSLASPFNDTGPISPSTESTSSPPLVTSMNNTNVNTTARETDPTTPISIPIPPPPVNSLSTTPYRSPPLPMNTNINMGMKTQLEDNPRKPSTSTTPQPPTPNPPTLNIIPPSPMSTSPPLRNKDTTPSTPPSTNNNNNIPNKSIPTNPPTIPNPPTTHNPPSPTTPTPTRLRTTIHLVLLQNQLKRRTEALRRALTSSSKHYLRSSYLEERVKELEEWIEGHCRECDTMGTASGIGVGVGMVDGTGTGTGTTSKGAARSEGISRPEILKIDAYGRPRERGDVLAYTRAIRPMDLKAMHQHQSQRSKSAGYNGYGLPRQLN